MSYKNTLKKGSVRYVIFKEADTWYGVALEFNIVEEGKDPLKVMSSLFEAIQGYVETAQKLKLRPMPLNQKPDTEYQKLWEKLSKVKKETDLLPKNVYNFGTTSPYAMAQ
ncbi:MAG: hypothetical protein NTY81_01475 [Candidatus Staskawiczbacteria bacterium]|nr:hypothetical protein [Candidatus Staskawiczbacteria bacterium]